MNLYGQRFLTASQFSSYCNSLNVRLLPFDEELEIYEKNGVMLPVARLIKPEEYLSKRNKLDIDPKTYGQRLIEWGDIERILHGPELETSADFDLWSNLDLEFKQGNKFLIKPTKDKYQKWNSYKAKVFNSINGDLLVNSAEHYYHYYQVHQVYAIQKKYPVFAQHNWFIENLNENAKFDKDYFLPRQEDATSTLSGNLFFYDALSFFIELYLNERRRTFAQVREEYGVKTLNEKQFEDYQNRIKQLSLFVLDKFDLKNEHFYKFLLFALELHNQYEKEEKSRLANDLMVDIQCAKIFLSNISGLSDIDIEKEIRGRNPTLVKKFRHSDKALEIQDYTRETFLRLRADYNNKFPTASISTQEIENLLDFINRKGLFIVPYSIFDIDETLNSERPFRNNSLYIGLTNLSIGIENFLRELANIANSYHGTKVTVDNFFSLISMFSWYKDFEQQHQIRKGKYGNDTFAYLDDVIKSPRTTNEIKLFAISLCARNLLAHKYILDQYLYYEWYGKIYTSICEAFLYSWIYASQRKWT